MALLRLVEGAQVERRERVLLDLESPEQAPLGLVELSARGEEAPEAPVDLGRARGQLGRAPQVVGGLLGAVELRERLGDVQPARGVVRDLQRALEGRHGVRGPPEVEVVHAQVVARGQVVGRHRDRLLVRLERLDPPPGAPVEAREREPRVHARGIGGERRVHGDPGRLQLPAPAGDEAPGQQVGRVRRPVRAERLRGILERAQLLVAHRMGQRGGAEQARVHDPALDGRVRRRERAGRLEGHLGAHELAGRERRVGPTEVLRDLVGRGGRAAPVGPRRERHGDEQGRGGGPERERGPALSGLGPARSGEIGRTGHGFVS